MFPDERYSRRCSLSDVASKHSHLRLIKVIKKNVTANIHRDYMGRMHVYASGR